MRIKKVFSFIFIFLFTFSVPRASSISFSKCRMIFRFFCCSTANLESSYCAEDGGSSNKGNQEYKSRIFKQSVKYENPDSSDADKDPDSDLDSGFGSAPSSSVSEEVDIDLFFKGKDNHENSLPIGVSNEIYDENSYDENSYDENSYDENEKIIFYKEGINRKNKTDAGTSPSAIMEHNHLIHYARTSNKRFKLNPLKKIGTNNKLLMRRRRNKPLDKPLEGIDDELSQRLQYYIKILN